MTEREGEQEARRGGGDGHGVLSTVPGRAIFCGSRGWEDPAPIREALVGLPRGTVVVVGGARGADKVAEREARALGLPVEVHPARWDEEGKGAGYRRNERMLNLPGVASLSAFRASGKSNGTDHMIRISRHAGIPTEVVPA